MTGKRKCFACDRTKQDDVVLYRFPTDPNYYSKWKTFCNYYVTLTDRDNLHCYWLCNKHFTKEDFRGTRKLKKNAIPSVITADGILNTEDRIVNVFGESGSITQKAPVNPGMIMCFTLNGGNEIMEIKPNIEAAVNSRIINQPRESGKEEIIIIKSEASPVSRLAVLPLVPVFKNDRIIEIKSDIEAAINSRIIGQPSESGNEEIIVIKSEDDQNARNKTIYDLNAPVKPEDYPWRRRQPSDPIAKGVIERKNKIIKRLRQRIRQLERRSLKLNDKIKRAEQGDFEPKKHRRVRVNRISNSLISKNPKNVSTSQSENSNSNDKSDEKQVTEETHNILENKSDFEAVILKSDIQDDELNFEEEYLNFSKSEMTTEEKDIVTNEEYLNILSGLTKENVIKKAFQENENFKVNPETLNIKKEPSKRRRNSKKIRTERQESISKMLALYPEHRELLKKFRYRDKEKVVCPICNATLVGGYLKRHFLFKHYSEPVLCDSCGITFPNSLALSYHKRTHRKMRSEKQVCDECGATFRLKTALEVHSYKVHKAEKKYECPTCQRKFVLERNLNTHIDIIHKKIRLFMCHCCGKHFGSAEVLSNHLRIHTAPKEFKCNVCDKGFSFRSVLHKHVNSVHAKLVDKKFFCTMCNKGFLTSRGLEGHMQLKVHKTEQCSVCSEFIYVDLMVKHMNEKHGINMEKRPKKQRRLLTNYAKSDYKKHVCNLCGEALKWKSQLEKHIEKVHNAEWKYQCTTCEKKFTTQGKLDSHIDVVHNNLRPYMCQICGKGFGRFNQLYVHMPRHTNARRFKCQFCGKGFDVKQNLQGHIKGVHGVEEEKSFFCSICNKGFSSRQGLKIHMNKSIHIKEQCSLCTETVIVDFMVKHMKEKHGVQVEKEAYSRKKVKRKKPEVILDDTDESESDYY